MNNLFFPGLEMVPDVVLLTVTLETLILQQYQADFGESGMFFGNAEQAAAK